MTWFQLILSLKILGMSLRGLLPNLRDIRHLSKNCTPKCMSVFRLFSPCSVLNQFDILWVPAVNSVHELEGYLATSPPDLGDIRAFNKNFTVWAISRLTKNNGFIRSLFGPPRALYAICI